MSTTAKGDSLVEATMASLIEYYSSSDSPYVFDCLRFWKNKKYFSPVRNDDIEFDIAIEILDRATKEITSYIFVECKNYARLVDAPRLEEFESKLRQITPCKSIAIFATSNGVTETCLNSARNFGIAIVRISQDVKLKWELRRTFAQFGNFETTDFHTTTSLLCSGFIPGSFQQSIYSYGKYCGTSLYTFMNLLHGKADSAIRPNNFTVPFVHKTELSKIASQIRVEIIQLYKKISYTSISEYIRNSKSYQVSFLRSENEPKLSGRLNFVSKHSAMNWDI
jgi:hypothetical protein